MDSTHDYPGVEAGARAVKAWLSAAAEAGEADALRAALEAVLHPRADAVAIGELPMRFGMIGASPAMDKLFALLERVAPSHVPVLIHGETGSGKELVARALHAYSPRKDQPFVAENCAAIAPTLLESELFGHVRGAFTDASRDRKGTFVTADGGTVFLDEIGDMPPDMQSKLLRVLQDGEVRPVGASKTQKVDVRIVAASHRDLGELVKQGRFREDLLFRLNVITLEVPSLRERKADLPYLATFLLERMADELGGTPRALTADALAALAERDWPGNVRELENLLRRAAALTPPGQPIDRSDLGS